LTTPYLEALWDETAWIDIRGLRVAGEAVHRFRIDELYTPLTTVLAATDDKEKSGQKTFPLQQVLENKQVGLVGDPGAGNRRFYGGSLWLPEKRYCARSIPPDPGTKTQG
jgi:hypothetical protein